MRLYLRKTLILFLSFLMISCSISGSDDSDNSITSFGRQRFRGSRPRVVTEANNGGYYKVGNPYNIFGTMYYPKEDYKYSEIGTASWYGKDFHAKDTANGERYDMNTLTAAHRTLPLPSIVKVTNLENGRSVILRVNDRGPYAKNRVIDISKRGAEILGYQNQGTTKVKVEIMAKESMRLKEAILNQSSSSQTSSYKPEVYKPSATNEKKFIQAGSFSTLEGAKNLQGQLSSFNNVNIYPVFVDGNKFYRVRIGPYHSEEQASRDLNKITNYGVHNSKIVTQ